MIPEFLLRSITAGIIAAVISSFIGVYVVLRRLSFFTHAISHGSLTGVAIAYIFGINPFATAIAFGGLIGLAIGLTMEKTKLYADSIIGTLLPASISIGLVIISLMKGYKPDLLSYLFGDILSVTSSDIAVMLVIGIIILIFLASLFNKITLMSIDEEWAKTKGINTKTLGYIFLLILSVAVIVGARVVGIILVSALIVMPPSSSMNIAKNLKQTFILSIIFSVSSVIIGIFASYILNIPSGPSIILVLSVIFLITFIKRRKK
ncbi:MAG: metal ABC transporter permease [Fervidobacterium sp.]